MEETPTWYRRPLPEALIPFASPRGHGLFREALEAGTLEGFFPLVEQFHTQADPAFCGLASLVMTLNALGIDPERTWRGPWRWFSEELLDCCVPLERVQQKGISLDQLACLARCNGASAVVTRPEPGGAAALREATLSATKSRDRVLIASYLRSSLEQTGTGHYSPIGGYHAAEDLVLILDVARFKYPPHWVKLDALFSAMQEVDADTGRTRGWVQLEKRGAPSAVARFLVCPEGVEVKPVLAHLLELHRDVVQREVSTLEGLLALESHLLEQSGIQQAVRFWPPQTGEHKEWLAKLSAQLHELPLYGHAAKILPPSAVVPLMIWMLSVPLPLWRGLPAALEHDVAALSDPERMPAPLRDEVRLLRSQVEFLLEQV